MFWLLTKSPSGPVYHRGAWFVLLLGMMFGGLSAQSARGLNDVLRENGQAFQNLYQRENQPPTYQRLAYWAGGTAVAAVMPFDQGISQDWRGAKELWKDQLATAVEPWGNPRYVLPASALSYGLSLLVQPGSEWEEVSGDAFRSLVATSAAVVVLKYATGRRRPATHPRAPFRFFRYDDWEDTPSFPSGHAALAFALASSLSRSAGDRWYWALPLYGLATATAWQRVYDGRHWPSDVIAGALLGTVLGRSFTRPESSAVSLQYRAQPGAPLGVAFTWRW